MGDPMPFFDNRVEIGNPGHLLFDKSKFGRLSVARNPKIFDTFYRLGIMEKIGSGIARMPEAMAERGIKIALIERNFLLQTLLYNILSFYKKTCTRNPAGRYD
jgi:predicted HTH transcriptional regulator